MRSFRKVALAGATAVAVAFGSTSVVSAQESDQTTPVVSEDQQTQAPEQDAPATEQEKREGDNASLAAKIGRILEADGVADGTVIFGSSDEAFLKEQTEAQAKIDALLKEYNVESLDDIDTTNLTDEQKAAIEAAKELQASTGADLSSQPTWAKLLFAGSIIAAIGAVFTLIVAPIANWFTFGPGAR